jgi:hypothetical protein
MARWTDRAPKTAEEVADRAKVLARKMLIREVVAWVIVGGMTVGFLYLLSSRGW